MRTHKHVIKEIVGLIKRILPLGGSPGDRVTVDPDGDPVWIRDPKRTNGFDRQEPTTMGELSWDDSTRTLTIDPQAGEDDYRFWVDGVECIHEDAQSVQVPDITDTYYFYFDGTPEHTLQYVAYSDITDPVFYEFAIVALVYWNATSQQGLPGDERHGCRMASSTHEYNHRTIGARYASGLELQGLANNSTTYSATASGKFWDEDVEHTIALETTNRFLYRNTLGEWTYTAADNEIGYDDGGNKYWNEETVPGTWALTSLASNRYMIMFFVATSYFPSLGQTYKILGQGMYTSANQAREAIDTELSRMALDGLPSPELIWEGAVIINGNGQLQTLSDGSLYYDLRTVKGGAPASGTPATFAADVQTDTTNFDTILSGADQDVQAALDTIDDHLHDSKYVKGDGSSNSVTQTIDATAHDILFQDTNYTKTQFIWKDNSAGKLFLGASPDLNVTFRSDIFPSSSEVWDVGSASVRFGEGHFASVHADNIVYGDGTDNGATTIETTGADFAVKDSADVTSSFILRDQSASRLYLGTNDALITARSNLLPNVHGVYDLGSSSVRWRHCYLDGTLGINYGGSFKFIKMDGEGAILQSGYDNSAISATFQSAKKKDDGFNSYRAIMSYDVYWHNSSNLWYANNTSLGRKWSIDMGYHNNSFRVRQYDGVVTSGWRDDAWTDVLTASLTSFTYLGNPVLTVDDYQMTNVHTTFAYGVHNSAADTTVTNADPNLEYGGTILTNHANTPTALANSYWYVTTTRYGTSDQRTQKAIGYVVDDSLYKMPVEFHRVYYSTAGWSEWQKSSTPFQVTNMDNLTDDPDDVPHGIWLIKHANMPDGGTDYWYLQTMRRNSNNIKSQIAITYASSSPEMYFRTSVSAGVWSDWVSTGGSSLTLPTGVMLTGNIQGLEYAQTTSNSITVQPGVCMDSTNTVELTLSSAAVVTIGTVANEIYNLFLCDDGVVRTDTDVDGATLLAGTVTELRWIGYVRNTSSGNLVGFLYGDDIMRFTKSSENQMVNSIATTFTKYSHTAIVPVERIAQIQYSYQMKSSSGSVRYLYSSMDGTNTESYLGLSSSAAKSDTDREAWAETTDMLQTYLPFSEDRYFRTDSSSSDKWIMIHGVKLRR